MNRRTALKSIGAAMAAVVLGPIAKWTPKSRANAKWRYVHGVTRSTDYPLAPNQLHWEAIASDPNIGPAIADCIDVRKLLESVEIPMDT